MEKSDLDLRRGRVRDAESAQLGWWSGTETAIFASNFAIGWGLGLQWPETFTILRQSREKATFTVLRRFLAATFTILRG